MSSSAEQVVILLTRIAESLETQTELLSAILEHRTNSAPAVAGDTVRTRTFDAEYIEVGYANGKKTYRVFGGPFTKFGIRVWPETLSKLGLSTSLDVGQHPFTQAVVIELNDDSNPQKVIGLAP